jgi:hypothetical protein
MQRRAMQTRPASWPSTFWMARDAEGTTLIQVVEQPRRAGRGGRGGPGSRHPANLFDGAGRLAGDDAKGH